MDFTEQLRSCMPDSAGGIIPWNRIEELLAPTCFSMLAHTQQNPVFHGEGDVYTHIKMVCRELVRNSSFHELSDRKQSELFLAAILHDIGKADTSRLENNVLISPHHSITGSRIARTFLWMDCGMCGSREMTAYRETVCALIRYHMLPVHVMNEEKAERRVREVASAGELAEDFSWKLLCMLAEADMRGRIADDIENGLTQVALAGLMAEETGCLHEPYTFADSFTKHAYLAGRNVQADQSLYDDSWGEVIMVSGLPGTGKDTWIREHHPDYPVVSLDDIRAALRVSPSESQGRVIQTAKEQARKHFRNHEPFIWNATNLTKNTRQKLTGLFERYGASVRIVYLETGLETLWKRNEERKSMVSKAVIEQTLQKTTPPSPEEARKVEWIYV